MVNELRLSPLATPTDAPAGSAPHLMAMASFAVLASLFLAGVGIQVLGDPAGGTPQISLTISSDAGNATTPEAAEPIVMAGDGALPADDFEVAAIHVLDADDIDITLPEPATRIRVASARGNVRLADAPIADLVEYGDLGPLPVVGPGGERAAQVYARPFTPTGDASRISLVIGGLGLNAQATQEAIETLPGEVTLSFVPYADDLQQWIDSARDHGHEVIIEVPMEPFDYPNNNPGPATLLTSNDWPANESQLHWVMSRAVGYVGLMNYQGARLTADREAYAPVLQDVADRGLIYLDDGSNPRSQTGSIANDVGGAWATANRRLDLRRTDTAVLEALEGLEETAAEHGVAMGVGFAYPVTLEVIRVWTGTLAEKGLVLAPLSATAQSEAS